MNPLFLIVAGYLFIESQQKRVREASGFTPVNVKSTKDVKIAPKIMVAPTASKPQEFYATSEKQQTLQGAKVFSVVTENVVDASWSKKAKRQNSELKQ